MKKMIVIIVVLCSLILSCKNEIKTKKVTGIRCTDCQTVFFADTTIIMMPSTMKNQIIKTLEGNFYFVYKDTLCLKCAQQREVEGAKLFQEGRKAYNSKNYIEAKQKFVAAIGKVPIGPTCTMYGQWLEKTGKKIEAMTRKKYEQQARRYFLEEGMDIDVTVWGSDYKYITLTYVLMGNVFAYNFQKSPMFEEMRKMGFRSIYFKDGYGYSSYLIL